MKQTGLITVPLTPTDWILGTSSQIVPENRVSDWLSFMPKPEHQARAFVFDTQSCTTFSAHNVIEGQIIWLLKNKSFTPAQMEVLKEYIDAEGNFNISDRFTAIMSGTTRYGNDFKTVADCIRKNGLLPEKDLPFGGNSWEEYHSPSVITPAMRQKALKILDIFTFQYDFVFFDNEPGLNDEQLTAARTAIAHAPIQIAMPIPATHALAMYKVDRKVGIYDTYEPFTREERASETRIHYGMRLVVTLATPKPVVLRTLKAGMVGEDVKSLQKDLNELLGTTLVPDGQFGNKTKQAVIQFQRKYALVADGVFGPRSRAVLLNELAKKKA